MKSINNTSFQLTTHGSPLDEEFMAGAPTGLFPHPTHPMHLGHPRLPPAGVAVHGPGGRGREGEQGGQAAKLL